MPSEPDNVIHELAVGDTVAIAGIVERAHTSDDVVTVVAAALFSPAGAEQLMARAADLAITSRDRQLVAIATAHIHGAADRVADLARDHLSDHPDSVLVAWITAASTHDAGTHDMSTHDAGTHDASTHDASTHDMSTHDMSTQNMSTHDMSTQNMSTHDMSTQNISTQNISTQNISTQNISTRRDPS